MNILFHSNQLCERGTETALFDYAIGNENILHNKSFIVIPDGKILCKERYESWQRRFEIFTYKTKEDLHSIIEDNSIDLLYEIEAGDQLNPVYEDIGIPLFVHAVFTTSCRHGDFYVPIHSFLNKKFNTAYPVLPHICRKRETTSDKIEVELSLPNDRIYTYGCIGGGGKASA